MVNTAAKRSAEFTRKPARATIRRRSAGGAARRRKTTLSPADINEIASTMHVPEGILHRVLSHYPEVACALARHRNLVA